MKKKTKTASSPAQQVLEIKTEKSSMSLLSTPKNLSSHQPTAQDYYHRETHAC